MGEPPTDDALVIQESLERPEEFARLYDRHAAEIHRYVMRRLGDSHADDITAQTFLIAFRNRARYDVARASARPWLYGIAGNLIGSHRRSAGAIAALPGKDRHVLLLVAWADFTYQECADALGVPVGTVRSRLSRARRKMRTALGADPTLVSDNGAVTHG